MREYTGVYVDPGALSADAQKLTLRLCMFHVNDQMRYMCCVFGGSSCRLLQAIHKQDHTITIDKP